MRYLVFFLCFTLSYSAWYLLHAEPMKTDQKAATVPILQWAGSQPFDPSYVPPPLVRDKWTDLEYQDAESISYNGYKITNSSQGLSLRSHGRRVLFIKNSNDGGMLGVFGLRILLNNGRKQVVYLSTTGGNHCCAGFVIVDLAKNRPRVIFRSAEYDVQLAEGDPHKNALMTFDRDNDGQMEITQETTYGLGMDCAEAANPAIYVGFAYDKKIGKYLPIKDFVPETKAWIEKLKLHIANDNKLIEKGQFTENVPCDYESDTAGVALNYIYIGKENVGYKYILDHYRTLDFTKNPFRFDKKYSNQKARQSIADLKRSLSSDKLYKAIYQR